MAVSIRHAGPGDEPAILHFVEELVQTSGSRVRPDEHQVRRYLATAETTILLAADERAVVGMLSYSTRPALLFPGSTGEIESLVVRADRRGEGIGKKLLRTGLRLMQDAGCVEISTSVTPENTRGQHLFFEDRKSTRLNSSHRT